jgi:hypothetical protein
MERIQGASRPGGTCQEIPTDRAKKAAARGGVSL